MFAVRRIWASDEERGAARAQAEPRVMAWLAVISGLFKPAAPPPFSQARPRAPRLPCNGSTQLPWIWRAEDSAPPARFSGLRSPLFTGRNRTLQSYPPPAGSHMGCGVGARAHRGFAVSDRGRRQGGRAMGWSLVKRSAVCPSPRRRLGARHGCVQPGIMGILLSIARRRRPAGTSTFRRCP